MTAKRILIVDDEPDIRQLLEITLARMGHETQSAGTLSAAYGLLNEYDFQLCLTDMNLPDGNGLELVRHIQQESPELPVAVITAYGSVETATSALKSGAFDFVSKPIELARVRSLVEEALKTAGQSGELGMLGEIRLLGNSAPAEALRSQIRKLARSQAPVFISGESGSGKELVARLIHANSSRAEQSFIAVNCGAIPSELMESEFFGHSKGSFTGAVAEKLGLFQAAQGGTLFLDEIADLPLGMQVKLLRAIQEKSVRSVGSNVESPVDVRILSATHKRLEDEVAANRFRQDLYYRINVIELLVPPLRERSQDIRQIGTELLRQLSESHKTEYKLNNTAWRALENYAFPGNVRELQNILERACALSETGELNPDDFQLANSAARAVQNTVTSASTKTQLSKPSTAAPELGSWEGRLDDYLQNIERQAITAALESTRWNKTAAAEKLGISFRALRYKLKKLEIE